MIRNMRTTKQIVRGLAVDGWRQIEDSVLLLLDANPQGLRNCDIAESLGLHSDVDGQQKDWLTWHLLKGLIDQGEVTKDGTIYKRKEE